MAQKKQLPCEIFSNLASSERQPSTFFQIAIYTLFIGGLGSSTYAGGDYDNIEEELNELELEIRAESSLVQPPKSAEHKAGRKPVAKESADLLAGAMSGLKLVDGNAATPVVSLPQSAASPPQRCSEAEPEAA